MTTAVYTTAVRSHSSAYDQSAPRVNSSSPGPYRSTPYLTTGSKPSSRTSSACTVVSREASNSEKPLPMFPPYTEDLAASGKERKPKNNLPRLPIKELRSPQAEITSDTTFGNPPAPHDLSGGVPELSGPMPPTPPATDEPGDDVQEAAAIPAMQSPTSVMTGLTNCVVSPTHLDFAQELGESVTTSAVTSLTRGGNALGQTEGIPRRASTEDGGSTSSFSTPLRVPRHHIQSLDACLADTAATALARNSTSLTFPKTTYISSDGHLQPPVSTSSRMPARRNTIASMRPSRAAVRTHQTVGHRPPSSTTFGTFPADDTSFAALDPDIEHQADQIRRERLSKRAKAQQAELEATTSARQQELDDHKPLVGNLIGEGHANYVLMYNMLTGIRTAVSRCQAKIRRPLTDEDYTAAHKYSFDIVGNELTPSAKYDFKFKDYAPWVFRVLREDYFQLDPADYLLSLTAKYILSELGSPGKSGSFFYFSRDYRFIIKTIHHTEHKYILSILKHYHQHIQDNPHTLMSRFYGLHRVKLPRGKKIHFVIMNNLFPPHRDIHETYDLKGSTVGREYPPEKARENSKAVLKDLNWINAGRRFELGPEKQALLLEQVRRDAEFLKRMNVMDYSLLVGIHNMQRGNRDNLRRSTLRVFQPDIVRVPVKRKPSMLAHQKHDANALRRAMRTSDPKAIDHEIASGEASDRQHLIFYQDEGGYRATDEANQPMDTIYYLGIIDILTPYNVAKRAEHLWKGLSADSHKISSVSPEEYATRFVAFLADVCRGGSGGQSFKPRIKSKTE